MGGGGCGRGLGAATAAVADHSLQAGVRGLPLGTVFTVLRVARKEREDARLLSPRLAPPRGAAQPRGVPCGLQAQGWVRLGPRSLCQARFAGPEHRRPSSPVRGDSCPPRSPRGARMGRLGAGNPEKPERGAGDAPDRGQGLLGTPSVISQDPGARRLHPQPGPRAHSPQSRLRV